MAFTQLRQAVPERDIPIIDVADVFAGVPGALARAGARLRDAQENVGFYYLTGHGVPAALIQHMFAETARFHAQPTEAKLAIRQNADNVGYMAPKQAVSRANNLDEVARRPDRVEAFFMKRDLAPDHPDVLAGKPFRGLNQWPSALPGFREACLAYCDAMEGLAKRLLPVYAAALDLAPDWFDAAFADPMFTLRLSHYPPAEDYGTEEYGIAPHKDSSFLTLLAPNEVPGLAVRSAAGEWMAMPPVAGAYVVNTGDMLARWTNDRFRATPHGAANTSGRERYAIPFFFDCALDHVMECLPTCTGPDNPPRYPPTTYRDYMLWYTTSNYANVAAARGAAE